MLDSTIIYVTANVENENFEEKVRNALIKTSSNLPIISVSRKPINFGTNICVGEKPVCYANMFRSLLIGAKTATTQYIHMAVSDALYPPENFIFEPPSQCNFYKYSNVWILHTWEGKVRELGYWRQLHPDGGSMVCNRLFFIEQIKNKLNPNNWDDIVDPPQIWTPSNTFEWSGINPIVNMKTGYSINKYTRVEKKPVQILPYWGKAVDICNEFCENKIVERKDNREGLFESKSKIIWDK